MGHDRTEPSIFPVASRASVAPVAVLAGGAGRRIGGSKAHVELAGRPLIAYPLAAAAAAGLAAMVVAKPGFNSPVSGCEIVSEPPAPRHPLCGIVAALEWARGRPVLVLGCDMPFVTGPLIALLAGLPGTVVASLHGHAQPLLARYEPEHLPALRRSLARERPLREAVAALAPTVVDERRLARFGDPERLCFNVNDREDLRVAEAWLTS